MNTLKCMLGLQDCLNITALVAVPVITSVLVTTSVFLHATGLFCKMTLWASIKPSSQVQYTVEPLYKATGILAVVLYLRDGFVLNEHIWDIVKFPY